MRLVQKLSFKSVLSLWAILGWLGNTSVFAQGLSPLQTPQYGNQTAPNNPVLNSGIYPGINPSTIPSTPRGMLPGPGTNVPINPWMQNLLSDPTAKLTPEYWSKILNKRTLNIGTVLTGVLDDTISSKTNKGGDVFSIVLNEGYTSNNNQLVIPINTRVVGTIMAASPASQKSRTPGTLQVSLQAIVLPDARSFPISASIEYNPNNKLTPVNNKRSFGVPAGQYGLSAVSGLANTASSITRTFGLPISHHSGFVHGNEFTIKKGELLPVRLTRPLDVTGWVDNPPIPPNPVAGNNQPGGQLNPGANGQNNFPGTNQNNIPGTSQNNIPGTNQNNVPVTGQNNIPGTNQNTNPAAGNTDRYFALPRLQGKLMKGAPNYGKGPAPGLSDPSTNLNDMPPSLYNGQPGSDLISPDSVLPAGPDPF